MSPCDPDRAASILSASTSYRKDDMNSKKIFRLGTLLAALVTMALMVAATASSGSNAARTLRATVGPGFSIKLTSAGKRVASLKAGTYKFVVSDRSAEHNFVLERESGQLERTLTSIAFVGTKTVTVKLTKGIWKFYCEPHASMMSGRFSVGAPRSAKAVGAVATRSDDRGGTAAHDLGDDRGASGEPEPGDDRGAGEVEAGDDRGGHGEPEPGDDRGGR
jgi:plastocyanin